LNVKGRGGTRFEPVFDYVRDNGIEPECLLYFTDLFPCDTPDPDWADYPVLWVAPEGARGSDPSFGTVVELPPADK